MELTIHFPCIHFRPASITSHFDESIITGTREISGSDASRLRKRVISCTPSSNPSSMFMSMTCAPSSTCLRAICRASSYFFSWIRRKNLREPATLHRSPIFTKLIPGVSTNSSRPERRINRGCSTGAGGTTSATISTYFAMCSGVVPQQPPTMFTNPSSINSRIWEAIFSGVSSYSPSWLGSPALG